MREIYMKLYCAHANVTKNRPIDCYEKDFVSSWMQALENAIDLNKFIPKLFENHDDVSIANLLTDAPIALYNLYKMYDFNTIKDLKQLFETKKQTCGFTTRFFTIASMLQRNCKLQCTNLEEETLLTVIVHETGVEIGTF